KIGSHYYQLPGGKIEAGEQPVTSLIRELKEELDVDYQEDECSFIGVQEVQAVNEVGQTVIGFVFHCPYSDKLKNLIPFAELKEVKWLKKSEREEVKLANLLKKAALPVWIV